MLAHISFSFWDLRARQVRGLDSTGEVIGKLSSECSELIGWLRNWNETKEGKGRQRPITILGKAEELLLLCLLAGWWPDGTQVLKLPVRVKRGGLSRCTSSCAAPTGWSHVCFAHIPLVTGSDHIYWEEALEKGRSQPTAGLGCQLWLFLLSSQSTGCMVPLKVHTYWIYDRFHELWQSVWECGVAVVAVAAAAVIAMGSSCGGALLR